MMMMMMMMGNYTHWPFPRCISGIVV